MFGFNFEIVNVFGKILNPFYFEKYQYISLFSEIFYCIDGKRVLTYEIYGEENEIKEICSNKKDYIVDEVGLEIKSDKNEKGLLYIFDSTQGWFIFSNKETFESVLSRCKSNFQFVNISIMCINEIEKKLQFFSETFGN